MEPSVKLVGARKEYLAKLKDGERATVQQDLNRFVNWYRPDQNVGALTPHDVERYVESLGLGGAGLARLDVVKGFLSFLRDKGYTQTNLAPHVKLPRTRRTAASKRNAGNGSVLTKEGHEALVSRLQTLQAERVQVTQDIQKAAADKDFRENAPLQAAREKAGFLEGQIAELREALRNASLLDVSDTGGSSDKRVRLGRKVTLKEQATGRQVVYTLVDTREANPAEGKISPVSPIGQALIDKSKGDKVSIKTPRGQVNFVIELIET